MRPGTSPEAPTRLAAEDEERFKERIRNGPTGNGVFSTWRGHFARDVWRDGFGVAYNLAGVCKWLHRLGFSAIMPRAKHPGSSEEEREEFEKYIVASLCGRLRQGRKIDGGLASG